MSIVYGVATVSRIDKIIGLFCRILSLLWGSFAKETYNLSIVVLHGNYNHRYVMVFFCEFLAIGSFVVSIV